MKIVFRLTAILLLVCGVAAALFMYSGDSTSPTSHTVLKEWNVHWIGPAEPKDQPPPPAGADTWHVVDADDPLTAIPEEAAGAWVRLAIPPTAPWLHPGVYIERLYGLDITVYEGSRPVYQSTRGYDFERNILLLPLASRTTPTELIFRIESKERAGISDAVRVGEFTRLSDTFIRKELPTLLLGASLVFLALILLTCTVYLHRNQRGPSVSLSLFILSTGTMMLTNSSMPYYYFPEYGGMLFFGFDLSMYCLFPTLLSFVLSLFEGSYTFLRKGLRWLSGYYAFCLVIMIVYRWIGGSFYYYYKLFTFWILAPLILLQLLLILYLSFRNAFRGNRSSIVLSAGMALLALSGIADLAIFSFGKGDHTFFLWKWGVVALIVSLILILNRRIASDYAKLLTYSKELELYNHELQKTEKMQIISDLAASIAHEIRNPLQVTRGFLQLLSGKSDAAARPHFGMAIEELDRAASIISDFLTFARPELDSMVPMNLRDELNKIEMIMSPLAAMNGGILEVKAADHLLILGNPGKFKQALINMVKNSIEAVEKNGRVQIEALAEEQTAVIRITDNGEGMEPEQVAKLGEPYFSTKTKGTGLGLMVTFRIIEAMKGKLEFRSTKGKGTEAIVRFPLV